jgi:glyoxylase-like metal-dependent hydrolase (beta-lactamase superfamily II)
MAILLEPDGIMFTGDAAGVSIVVEGKRIRLPTTPPPFKAELYIESVQRMAEFRPVKVVPTHYGVDPMNGVEYLNDHILSLKAWLKEVKRIVDEGITDIMKVAELVAERIPEAGEAYYSGNPIIVETFYKSTIWGMIEYFKNIENSKN